MERVTPRYNWSFLWKFNATLAAVNFGLAFVGVFQILYVDASNNSLILTGTQLILGVVLLLLALYYRGKGRQLL